MIVKVQISLNDPPRCLVYNKHRDWEFEGPMEPNDPLYDLMKGRKKAYFHATPIKNNDVSKHNKFGVIKNAKGKPKQTYTIDIHNEACRQDW